MTTRHCFEFWQVDISGSGNVYARQRPAPPPLVTERRKPVLGSFRACELQSKTLLSVLAVHRCCSLCALTRADVELCP